MQVAIDGCKREYEVTAAMEIERIKKMECMQFKKNVYDDEGNVVKQAPYDLPFFMQFTKEIKMSKGGIEREYSEIKKDKERITGRINPNFVCPMNWLQECFNGLRVEKSTPTKPTNSFFIKMTGRAHDRQMSKIRKLVEEYDFFLMKNADLLNNEDGMIFIAEETEKFIEQIQKIRIGNPITINRLIETALGLDTNTGGHQYKKAVKYTRRMMNILYKTNKEKFMMCFTSNNA